MGVEMSVTYQGDLRCTLVHGPSGQTFITDAPVDNQGRGEAFSPTDLVAAALGACLLTTMGIVARRRGIAIAGSTAAVVKEMESTPRRHIGRISVSLHLPSNLSEEERRLLESTAVACPVHASLGPSTLVDMVFRYDK